MSKKVMSVPVKRVKTDGDLAEFQRSPAYCLIVSYLEKLCLAIKGDVAVPVYPSDAGISALLGFLQKVKVQVDSIDPIDQPMRFGNKAFRTLHSFLTEKTTEILRASGISDESVLLEIKPYLLDSFGNPTRIDYGTGHEASFFFALVILMERRLLELSAPVVTIVFREYIHLVRLITCKYAMEPAGSHGVWGLDDYHHLPFLFGASQLIGLETATVHPSQMVETAPSLVNISLFADCIQFICETKGRFAKFEKVAPLLSDLLKSDSWSHACMSLMRLYKREVLGKRPIVQHFLFGETLKWKS